MSRFRFRSRWLAGSLCAASCSLLGSGCANSVTERGDLVLPVVRVVKMPASESAKEGAPTFGLVPVLPPSGVVQASHQEMLPAPVGAEEKPLPINLDTVLRLAEEHNKQIALARERLHESETEQSLAAKAWLPKVFAGVGYYRHEGGIQNEDGTLIHSSTGALFPGMELHTELDLREATFLRVNAERNAWQQRGELSKVTSETLLEAATTYLDLLTARRGEAVAKELEKFLLNLQERTEKLVTAEDRSAQVLVEAVRGEAAGRRQAIARLHQQGDAAASKLSYLLGLGSSRLVPVEEALTPIDLVDPTGAVDELVTRALSNGPGVRELQGLLGAIQDGLNRINGPLRLMPTFQLGMVEGAFGAGPGSQLSFDNRWDLAVQVRWNLTEFITAREKRRLAESRLEQARLTFDDLRGKLTAGVEEARAAILSGREQITHGAKQISHAAEAYRLSNERLKLVVPGATTNDVLQAIRGLETAHYNYLTAINAYNKAQIRLLVLLGPTVTTSPACAAPPAELKK